ALCFRKMRGVVINKYSESIMAREKWPSRLTFILASIGSAVGLGNAWRFPGLAAKHGGGAFLFAYVICMAIIGLPLLMMELGIGRRMRSGVPNALKGLRKGGEYIGWAATSNAFVIVTYYAAVFAWVIMMCVMSFKFAGMTGSDTGLNDAQNLWMNLTGATGGVSFAGAGGNIPILLVVCLAIAWLAIYFCIKDGASSVSKVVKYTVFIPLLLLVVLAIKGFTMSNTGAAMKALFVPQFSAMGDATLWVDAVGQAFYSLSVMMAIMVAYGSFLDRRSNIVSDAFIIAFSDFLTSVLSGIVLFTTLYGSGMTVDDMSASGITTAFMIYPMAIVQLTSLGWVNAIFGIVFYLMLITLTIDSAFSIVEGVSASVADKFGLNKKKTTKTIIIVAAVISVVYITGAGLGWLDIVDNWINQYNLIIVGILECVLVGWLFKPGKVLKEINKNTKKLKMPKWWFYSSVMVIAPLSLFALVIWNIYTLAKSGGLYGGYPVYANVIAWVITILIFSSGFIIKLLSRKNKKIKALTDNAERNFRTWDEMEYLEAHIAEQKAECDCTRIEVSKGEITLSEEATEE
ncbi:MAG: sodium-dependent transporter, partial [Clostridia bacterium]|nr:sodium-dependent transporter [Clostridia bacterium]